LSKRIFEQIILNLIALILSVKKSIEKANFYSDVLALDRFTLRQKLSLNKHQKIPEGIFKV
jgi:hypothetical protein